MFLLYDLIFLIIAVVFLPAYLFKGKFHKGFLSRLGFLPANLALKQPIWVHAVSVGEAMAVKGLIDALRKKFPGRQLVISSVTPTGNKVIRDFAVENDFVTYLPLDFSFITEKVVKEIYPSLVIIAETELWPNFILSLSKRGIPVLVVNARISDKSLRGYLWIRQIFKPILNKVDLFCAQSSRDAERLRAIGVAKEKVRVTGNMKFDAMDPAVCPPDAAAADAGFKQGIGLAPEAKLLVAGSTHPGEEEIVLGAYRSLSAKFTSLRLVLAPRHPHRSAEIIKLVVKYGFNPFRVSQLSASSRLPAEKAVLILDVVGRLKPFYAASDIVFVGGSLIKKGGHNIIEPACFAKSIICGPHMFNFRDIADLFAGSRAFIIVKSGQELEKAAADLLDNPSSAAELGKRARELVAQNQGATLKNLECARELLKC
ncbi:MAG: 3-deoxy-D-manno-octulosonic acid transferase [Candidatus Omnitrophota bacterium]